MQTPFFSTLLAYGVSLLIVMASPDAYATRSVLYGADRSNAESAIYFAERQKWNEALLHAKRSSNTALRDYITWLALKDTNSDLSFDMYEDFLKRNPGWPNEKTLIANTENRLFHERDTVDLARQIYWLNAHKPISGRGKIVYAEALRARYGEAKMRQSIEQLVREAWIVGDFDASEEKIFLQRYGKTLREEDHIARIDRLLWEEKTTAAARLLFTVPKSYQALFEARARLALNKPGAMNVLAKVPPSLRSNPGLLFERMRWRAEKDMDSGVEEILLEAPTTVPYPEKWWKYRYPQARRALDSGKYTLALTLLQNHSLTEGPELADALWLKGWVHLKFAHQANAAFNDFKDMDLAVQFPVSKARAAYWAGRAADAGNQKEVARTWYAKAALHPTTFYGQLAAARLQPGARLNLPTPPNASTPQRQAFDQDTRTKIVFMLAELNRHDQAYAFIGSLLETAKTAAEAKLAADLGNAIGKRDFSVKAAKDALKQQIILTEAGYPTYSINFKPPIEDPLMWAITRQESLFDPYAQSSAGAEGLMQLLPSTAAHIAKKRDIPYSSGRLNDAAFNLRLGSNYLDQLIETFDGSYVLAIAAYNAGPGRVREWLDENGYPGKTADNAADWIERIPYTETRNYVQRVLENLEVYRAVLGASHTLKITEDLTR